MANCEAPRSLLRVPPFPAYLQALQLVKNGSYNTLGINKLSPKCGEHHSFAKFSVLVEKGTPDDLPPVG